MLSLNVPHQIRLYLFDPNKLLVDSLYMVIEFHFLLSKVTGVQSHAHFVKRVDLLLQSLSFASLLPKWVLLTKSWSSSCLATTIWFTVMRNFSF